MLSFRFLLQHLKSLELTYITCSDDALLHHPRRRPSTSTSEMQIKLLGLLFAALVPFFVTAVARPTPDPHAVGLFYLLTPGRFLHPLSHEPEPLHLPRADVYSSESEMVEDDSME